MCKIVANDEVLLLGKDFSESCLGFVVYNLIYLHFLFFLFLKPNCASLNEKLSPGHGSAIYQL